MNTNIEEVENNEERHTEWIRPGYSEQVINKQALTGPSVLGSRPGLSLAMMKKPDLRQAVEMPGGVRKHFGYHFKVFLFVFVAINLSEYIREPNPIRTRLLLICNVINSNVILKFSQEPRQDYTPIQWAKQ